MEEIFQGTMSFITRNLRKVQGDQSVNSLGTLEITIVVFEELLVNALIHRDYFVSATCQSGTTCILILSGYVNSTECPMPLTVLFKKVLKMTALKFVLMWPLV